ncbi:hypothetical protein C8J56DRAFT_971975 [Mycena floridula]|nr:hypothetical protein C8J56DRAFT_971975 [Mycena floridula]
MSEIVDIYEVGLLLKYERGTTDPRFRHAKLWEAIVGPDTFKTDLCPLWNTYDGNKEGFLFRQDPSVGDEPDLPSNMLPSPAPSDALRYLSSKRLETIFWQARDFDSCFQCTELVQLFFNYFPSDTSVRVRTVDGKEYTTQASNRRILEMDLVHPNLMTMSMVMPVSEIHITGMEPEMVHAVVGFFRPQSENIDTILDLASMQFGDTGRGIKGKGVIVLESYDAFSSRIFDKVAQGGDYTRASHAILPNTSESIELWLKQVARRAKQRWDKRETDPWCGHCGAPARDAKRCSLCKEARYCDAEHQTAAWPLHKHFCSGNQSKK